jgi:hypothetical protein
MASFKQLQLFADKEIDQCLQIVARPFTEHVYFPDTPADPLGIESMLLIITTKSLFTFVLF